MACVPVSACLPIIVEDNSKENWPLRDRGSHWQARGSLGMRPGQDAIVWIDIGDSSVTILDHLVPTLSSVGRGE